MEEIINFYLCCQDVEKLTVTQLKKGISIFCNQIAVGSKKQLTSKFLEVRDNYILTNSTGCQQVNSGTFSAAFQ